ncbi:DUF418 domain-containing protein [Corynebacterium bovis]|uniref:DUF418 domain-containing protein n=1 Tax=Corynebacterium bovis TaxID=36808 RepID=UPI000F6520D0|nr:DUF418 domain-containing protein [Corynebacterium bovis]RRQ14223.1 hypothetical protein CXF46_10655 [Corynebacterium bovis]
MPPSSRPSPTDPTPADTAPAAGAAASATAPAATGTAPATPAPTGTTPAPAARIVALDVLRGFALCGILVVNIPPLLWLEQTPGTAWIRTVLDITVQERFFPLFSLLFGISFGLLWHRLETRDARPRVVMLRRLLMLLVLGVVHQQLQPGEALLPYALVGLVVLLPLTWVPRTVRTPVHAVLGVVATLVAVHQGGGVLLVPALLVLGVALAHPRVLAAVTGPSRGTRHGLAVVAAVTAAVAVAGAVTWTGTPHVRALPWFSPAFGLATMVLYATTVLLLLRSRVGGVVRRLWEPFGRTALSNYVGATLLVLAAAVTAEGLGGVPWRGDAGYPLAVVMAVVILLVQYGLTVVWLRHFRQGPLEWAWRCVTYRTMLPIRR